MLKTGEEPCATNQQEMIREETKTVAVTSARYVWGAFIIVLDNSSQRNMNKQIYLSSALTTDQRNISIQEQFDKAMSLLGFLT